MHSYISFALLFIIVLITFVLLLIGFIHLLTGKSFLHILKELKYELIYNVVGFSALFDDWVLRHKNIATDLPIGTGRNALITGGARGIGAEVVKSLLQHDLHVIIACRNVEAGKNLYKQLRQEGVTTGSVDVQKLDLESLNSVRSFAKIIKEKYNKIHILINNAGKMFGPFERTIDGYESQLATNYLGHFLLTHLLMPEIIAAGEPKRYARIVNVSSCAHVVGTINFEDMNLEKQYISSKAYAQSKLAQTVWEGSVSIVYTSLGILLERATGVYISNCQITPMGSLAYSTNLQKKLFDFTNNLLGIDEFGKQ
ncbi:hypothetical protein FQR65_LT10122 [Abscondita terminalis]|nr:hypothetical protein FQR65_LT10122 [Abscondita terminalis]